MSRSAVHVVVLVPLVMAWAAAGCGGEAFSGGEDPGTVDGSDDASGDPGTFVGQPDGGGTSVPCELLDDDCPAGAKCSAYASDDGEVPDAARCVPLASPAAQVDEACTVEGGVATGLDDCDRGLACWDVDPDTLEGVCVPLCEAGAPPTCTDSNRRCRHAGGPLRICLHACDPSTDACGEGQGCYPLDGWPSCLPDASGHGGHAGDPCMFVNGCTPGLRCAPAEDVPGCRASDCCSPFCELSGAIRVCPGAPEQMCVPFFEDGTAPEGLEDLGVCAVP